MKQVYSFIIFFLLSLLVIFFGAGMLLLFPAHAAERPAISNTYDPADQANEFANAYKEWVTIVNARFKKCKNTCTDVSEPGLFKNVDLAYKRFHSVFQQIYK